MEPAAALARMGGPLTILKLGTDPDAVRQWNIVQYLLSGQSVEIETQIAAYFP